MTTRTLFIGLDGATFTVLDYLTNSSSGDAYVMPFLGKLIAQGSRGVLKSTPNPLTPPAWVSLMTGRSPGVHGVYDFIRAEERDNDVFFTLYDARDCRVETIWSIASKQQKRIAALNFPFTAPPSKNINGFLVPGFIPWRHLRQNTLPRDFYDNIKQIPEFNAKELAWDFEQEKKALDHLSPDDCEQWVRYHLPREKQWFRIAEYILKNESPDLMAVMFDGVDKLQHQAWQFLDPDLQKHPLSDYHKKMRRLCLKYFQQLDQFIQRLVELVDSDAQIYFASDHGFTATYEIVRINAYLHEKGYLHWLEGESSEFTKRREESMFANLDWNKTVAYCRTPSSNGIHIRIADNPNSSGVRPENYEQVRNQLIVDLTQLKDDKTGERIIKEIYRREDVFSGPAMKEAPDLLLVLRDFGFVSIKNKLPVIEPRLEPAGTHHPEGIFIANGKGIIANQVIQQRNIVDVGATLLYSLGLKIPSDLEGQVPQHVFTETYLKENPIVLGPPTDAVTDTVNQEAMSEDEKDKLMAQLQMLGYVE